MNASIIVDNFFEDPEDIHRFSNEQEYEYSNTGHWPGQRTVELCRKYPDFGEYLIKLLFKHGRFIYTTPKTKVRINSYFHRITPFSDNPDDTTNKGFIHHDYGEWGGQKNNGKVTHTAIVYLNYPEDIFAGTTIFQLRNKVKDVYFASEIKVPFLTKKIKVENFDEKMQIHWEQFEEDYECKNKFNRMFSFDSRQYHGVKTFFSESKTPRLTLVSFLSIDDEY